MIFSMLTMIVGCAPKTPPVMSVVAMPAAQVVSVSKTDLLAHTAHHVVVNGANFVFGATVMVDGKMLVARVDDEHHLRVSVEGLIPGRYDLIVTNPSATPSVLHEAFLVTQADVWACDRVAVPFLLDSTRLDGPGHETLMSHLSCFDARSDPLLVEGFANDHFSTEFALAAGYQRAALVATTLTGAGVRPDQLRVITYGREAVPDALVGGVARVEIHAGLDYPIRVIPASQVYGLPEVVLVP